MTTATVRQWAAFPAVAVVLVCLMSSLTRHGSMVAWGVGPAFADEASGTGETTGRELRRLRSELARERWEALMEGRPERHVEIFRAHAGLLSSPTLEALRAARGAAVDSGEIHRLETLELELARHAMLAGVARQDDEIVRLMSHLEADVEDYPRPLTLRELDHWIALDPDSLRVRMLESVRQGLWRDRLDPLFESRRTTIDSLAFAFGYEGYTEFSARLRQGDPGRVLAQLFSLVRATDTMYQVLTGELSQPRATSPAGRGSKAPHLSSRELLRLEWTEAFDRYVDPALTLARAVVDTTPGGAVTAGCPTPVVTSVARPMSREGLSPVILSAEEICAEVVAIDPAADIRVAVADLTGVAAARAALAAAGRARMLCGPAPLSPDDPEARSHLVGLASGYLSAGLVSIPEWYEGRRRLDRAAGIDSDIARLSDANLARLIRWRLWCDLKWIRTDLASGLLTELMRHRAGTDLWRSFVFVPTGSGDAEIIRQIRGFARGGLMTPAEAYDVLRPGADFLGAMDEARGVALAATVEESLRVELGPEWFLDPTFNREPVFPTGDISFDPLRRRFERLFDWSEKALEGVR